MLLTTLNPTLQEEQPSNEINGLLEFGSLLDAQGGTNDANFGIEGLSLSSGTIDGNLSIEGFASDGTCQTTNYSYILAEIDGFSLTAGVNDISLNDSVDIDIDACIVTSGDLEIKTFELTAQHIKRIDYTLNQSIDLLLSGEIKSALPSKISFNLGFNVTATCKEVKGSSITAEITDFSLMAESIDRYVKTNFSKDFSIEGTIVSKQSSNLTAEVKGFNLKAYNKIGYSINTLMSIGGFGTAGAVTKPSSIKGEASIKPFGISSELKETKFINGVLDLKGFKLALETFEGEKYYDITPNEIIELEVYGVLIQHS